MLKQNQAEDRRASPAFEVRQQQGNEPEPPSLASSLLLAASPTQISCSKFKGRSFENGLRLLPFPGEPTVCALVFPALPFIARHLCPLRVQKKGGLLKTAQSNLRSNGRRREPNLPPSDVGNKSSSTLPASSAVISPERCFGLPLTSTQSESPCRDLVR